jgi:GNAT superfamily N-acetyltransferase
MEIRPVRPDDLRNLFEIDGTIRSAHYLHVDQSGEGLGLGWKLEERLLRSPLVLSNPLGDELAFLLKQIVSGADEGLALVAEHEKLPVALLLARPEPQLGALRLADVRVDFDFRRQGLATALLYMAIAAGRDQQLRAVGGEIRTDNAPAAHLLAKCGFELTGIDTCRHTNHDLVKESATTFWYAKLD